MPEPKGRFLNIFVKGYATLEDAAQAIAVFSACLQPYPATQHLRIGVRRITEKIYILETDGEKQEINPTHNSGKCYELVSAQAELYRDGLEIAPFHCVPDLIYV